MSSIVIQPVLEEPKTETKSIPPVTVEVADKKGSETPIKTNPVSLSTASSKWVKDSSFKPPKPKNPFFRGQRTILESNANFVIPPDKYSSTPFAVSIVPTNSGKIKFGYAGAKEHEWGPEINIEEFCGQMTALVNILLRNSVSCVDTYYGTFNSGADDAVITTSHALYNLLYENFMLNDDDSVTPINDYGLDCDEVVYDFALKLEPEFIPPALDDYPEDDKPEDYDAEILDASDPSPWGDEYTIDEFSSAMYHRGSSYQDDALDEASWTPKCDDLLLDTSTINWKREICLASELSADLPESPNEFIVGIKDFCSALSDELFVLVDTEQDLNSPIKKLISLNSITLYLGLLTFKEIESIIDNRCNVLDLRLSKYDYTEIRVSLASCILSFCGIDVLNPADYGSVDITTDPTTGATRSISLLTEVERCIDRAFYYGTLQYLDI